MSKQMTPCEKLGYKVGDEFEVISHHAFKKGQVVTLHEDDGTECPLFAGDGGGAGVFDGVECSFATLNKQVRKIANKLKPAKQALADAIHQNGGWPIEVHWLLSTSSRVGAISFWVCRPKFNYTDWFEGVARRVSVVLNRGLPNWHQTILSREEYYHAYPSAADDGWIEWSGAAKSPASKGVAVDVKMKNGTQHFGQLIDDECWGDHWGDASIIAYRPHKQDVKPDFCESVTRSIPEPAEKPTIGQLAQDYSNKLDYANRKRKEADDAKAEADAALGELERAGEAIGLLIGVAKPEPELVIADWRDLQIGDIIEYVDGRVKDKIGMTGPVVEFAPEATDGLFVRLKCDNGPNKGRLGWPTEWRFIRRP